MLAFASTKLHCLVTEAFGCAITCLCSCAVALNRTHARPARQLIRSSPAHIVMRLLQPTWYRLLLSCSLAVELQSGMLGLRFGLEAKIFGLGLEPQVRGLGLDVCGLGLVRVALLTSLVAVEPWSWLSLVCGNWAFRSLGLTHKLNTNFAWKG